MEKPFEVLERVVSIKPKYILIHRQTFTEGRSHLRTHESYGGFSYQSVINRETFAELTKDYEEVEALAVYDNSTEPHVSVLLRCKS